MLKTYSDFAEFSALVSSFLEENEAENSLFLGQFGIMISDPPPTQPFMATFLEGDQVLFAAFYRERNLIVSRGPGFCIEPLVQELLLQNVLLPGVIGPKSQAEEFSRLWAQARGCESKLAMDQLLYQLDEVIWPKGIDGRMRLASVEDLNLTTEWSVKFIEDALPAEAASPDRSFEKMKDVMAGRIANKMIFLWEVGGKPVSMAAHARPSRRGMTVNLVYTPKEYRKRGYATALVAAVSQEALSRGKEFCALYTDLSNPTSNSIYQKIGYRKVSESRNFVFHY